MQLILPSADLEETYREFMADYKTTQDELVPWVLSLKANSFKELVDQLLGFSEGVGVQDGFVPHTTFWLIDDHQKLLGVSNLRHHLTPSLEREGGHIGYGVRPTERGKGVATRLLEMTLKEAKKRGIERALITCDKSNLASARVIEKNGGCFDSEFQTESGKVVNRYWVVQFT